MYRPTKPRCGVRPRSLSVATVLYVIDGVGSTTRILAVNRSTNQLRTVLSPLRNGTGPQDIAAVPDGTLYVANGDDTGVCAIRPGKGECETIAEAVPGRKGGVPADAVAVGRDGTVYAAVSLNARIVAIDPKTRRVWTIAGVTGTRAPPVTATSAEIGQPAGLAVGADGTLYFADFANHRIRAIDPATGKIHAVAGTTSFAGELIPEKAVYAGGSYTGDDGVACQATLNAPRGLTVSPGGAIYVADSGNNRVRAIGTVLTPPASCCGRRRTSSAVSACSRRAVW
ncbi:NHL domain-containing protein [Amycolatopsis speibonae]|uniref:Teneurin NHL domain-containing protein n=1 Tax=Amycolatopsis speibonae TaxID=1450224 RepID=A0ABV7P195_9PSEU